jgi:DNA helicase-2/ATP-dependent DNA helicase PcrA
VTKVKSSIYNDLAVEKIDKARNKNGKTAVKNASSKESKKHRLSELNTITNFTYSPVSNNSKKGSLNHSEIIKIGSNFISQHKLMQEILINKYPILLIDESQDTDKKLLESFIATQQAHQNKFSLGLFGDMMQRIYNGGKEDLGDPLPLGWKAQKKQKTIAALSVSSH